MLRALLFDLDNTLLDRAAVFRRYAEQQLERLRIPRDSRENVFNKLVASDRLHQHREFREYAELMTTNVPELGMSADEFHDEYIPGLLAAIEPETEVCEMLRRLSATLRMAVVTNGHSMRQRDKLRRTGLEKCFESDAIFVSSEVGEPKPHPLMFMRALSWAGCKADEVLFIGDDAERDMAGASAAGFLTCWVYGSLENDTYPGGYPEPSWRIQRICELETLLPRIMKS